MRVLVIFSFCQAMTILREYQYTGGKEAGCMAHDLESRRMKSRTPLEIGM